MSPEQRTAIVTGASRNIGRAVVLELARRGYHVVLNARTDSEDLRRTAGEVAALAPSSTVVVGDVADADVAPALVAAATDLQGRADILVHVPAVRPLQPFLEMEPEDWDHVLATNLTSLYHAARAVLPEMVEQGWGRIIGFSGAKAFRGHRIGAHVSASKAGVVGLLRVLAYEFGDRGITANVIVPGPFDTTRADAFSVGDGREYAAAGAPTGRALPPVGRLGDPAEIGHLCAYLVSEEAGFVTGQCHHINGGVDFY